MSKISTEHVQEPTSKGPQGACALPPPSYFTKKKGSAGYALMSKDAWPFDDDSVPKNKSYRVITYSFLQTRGWTRDKELAVTNTIKKDEADKKGFKTWEHFANIEFELERHDPTTANIRVGFEPGTSWSAVGQGAKQIDSNNPTLNLGWLQNHQDPSPEDRSTILHEFGHALGMMHEHQSPARGQYIHLKELEVYRYYQQYLGDRATVKSQIIDTYNDEKIMNMSRLDLESIMMYFMPAYLNEEGIDIPVNKELSTLDKAFIMLNYPPNLNDKTKLADFFQAMIDAGVTDKAAGELLKAFLHPSDTNPNPDFALRFKAMRKQFSDYNKNAKHLRSANAALLHTIDPESLTQFGIRDFIGNVVGNKLFQSVVKNVVKNTLLQRGVPLKQTIPGASPPEVARMIGGLVVHPQVAEYVTAYNGSLRKDDGLTQSAIFAGREEKQQT